MEDTYDSVLWVARECYVYRLPPRTSTAGYKAAEWGDMEAFLWKGRVRIVETITSGNPKSQCTVRLEDANTGELFANCPFDVDGKAVEPVLDSQRYFVLRVVDASSGQKAFLGMGFLERSDSFDFNVALQDWTKRQRVADQVDADPASSDPTGPSPHLPSGPKKDFSLKEGQTISINLGGKNRKKPASGGGGGLLGEGGGAMPLLPPPPPPRGR